jgi:uncharacterized protein YbbC (DUF1343 family)
MIPGVRFYPTLLQPTASYFSGKSIEGVRMTVFDRESFSAVRLGLEIAVALEKLYPGKIDYAANLKLIGSRAVVEAIRATKDPRQIESSFQETLQTFAEARGRALLYQ